MANEFYTIKHYINGQWVQEENANTEPMYNPSTGEVIGEVPMGSDALAQEAIDTAAEAFKTWKNTPIAKRMGYIFKMRELMERDAEALAYSIAIDQAKHISEARGEVRRVIEILEATAGVPALIQGDTLDNIAMNINGKVVRKPLGVFGGVAPFNFPALVFGWFIPVAIATGNTFIYKPSTQSPLFMQKMIEIFMEIGIPAGVVNVIYGSRSVAAPWYEDPRVAGVCLVGSTPTAKAMAKAAGESAKRSMLLGGAKNMLLVMEDTDMDIFIDNFLNSCYGSAGQRCLAGSIVGVVPEIYDEVCERIAEASKKVVVGDAMDDGVYMGPLISQAAKENVEKYVDIALEHGGGCSLLVDGRNPEVPEKNKNGYYVGPTVLKDVTPCNPVFSTEVFGPLVSIVKVADMDDAINLINGSEFGNGACIFTQNMHYAETFSREAEVGMIGVNVGICAPHPYLPFGGIKGSLVGTDKVQGKDAVDFYTQNKVVTVRTYHPDPEVRSGKAKPTSSNVRSCVAS